MKVILNGISEIKTLKVSALRFRQLHILFRVNVCDI